MFTWQQQLDDHLAVRPLKIADAPALFSVIDAQRDDLRVWLPWPDSIRTVADEEAFLRVVENWHRDGSALVCGIFVAGQFSGTLGLNVINRQSSHGQIGYWLAPSQRGRGIMTRCVRALIQWSFDALRLSSLDIRAALGNHRSRAIAHRLGFTHTHDIPQAEQLADRLVDHAVYILARTQWRARETGAKS